ncbi:hypothetical protein L0222_09685 [bacterium]|nr:hypothetical protein [bacterium]
MKINRPTIWTLPEPVQEKPPSTPAPGKAVEEKTTAPVELQRNPSPKTDSVEMKPNSNVILDNLASTPKLDPTQSINPNQVPAALIPGVPFREKAELPKTLPNGTSVDSGVGSGDLGFGKTRPGPNHTGIDMKGNDIRNQLNDALNLKEGAGAQPSTPPSSGTVNYTGLGGARPEAPKYDAGFNRPGMGLASFDADRNPFKTLTKLPEIVEKVTGRAADFLDGIKAIVNPQEQEKKKLNEKEGDGIQEYVNPDSPEGTQPVITEETLEKIQLRRDSTTQPGVQEDLGPIDGSKLSEADPRRKLISNPNPEDQSSITPGGDGHVVLDAKGPDTVNPNDPELGGGGEPIVIDPNRPRG